MGNNSSCCCSCSPSNEDYEDLITKLDTVKEMSEVDQLISYIDQLLNAIGQGRQVATTAQVGSSPSINSAGGLLEAVLKRSKHICKRDIMPNLNRETRKFVIDVTNQAAQIKWVGVALSVVGFVLERIDQISSNKNECIELLKYMCDLAKYIKQLDKHLGEEKLNGVLQFIVKGCLMCISQMESNMLSKFFAAPIAAEDLRKFKGLGHEYQELSLEAIIAVLNRTPVVLPPTQGVYPQADGLDEARKHVTELLDMKGGSVRAVVIWGQGGIGKTTLASAVFKKLDLKAYKYCRVVMEQDCLETDLKLLQQQILGDLFGRNINLRDWIEGRENLSEGFRNSSQPVFIFIDNALKESDLEKLLPISALTSLPAQSRILLTTRNLNETRAIVQATIERIDYQVASLPQQDAVKCLSVYTFGSDQESFDPDIDINGLLDICQGIPLVLQLAGKRLCEHAKNMQKCKQEVEYLKSGLLEGAEGEISERMVDFVYRRLGASCKEGFLDIVFFFINWERSIVASAIGEIEFQELQRAALVNITDEDRVNVHDIVKARGRILSLENGERITDEESLTDVLQNVERIKKTKGICLDVWFDFELEASHLNLMKKCLRVLILKRGTKIVNGEYNGGFENLRLLSLENDNIYSQMDVSKHRRLAVLILSYNGAYNFPEVASITSSLKYVFIENATLVNFSTILSQFQTLRSLALKGCRGFESLPETIRCLHALEKLDLSYCSNLISLPDSFGNLFSLTVLNLNECSSLASLSNNFGNLVGLVKLDLVGWSNLTSLPDSFGNLSSLTELDLSYCTQLSVLPKSFGNLGSLEKLSLHDCEELLNLPQNFGNLVGLVKLDLSHCSNLISLPDSFGNLSSLTELDLSDCTQLSVLAESFGNLGSLEKLILERCEKLLNLPQNFGNLVGLVKLDLSSCSNLISLPDSFGNLSSLTELDLRSCTQLSVLPESFGNLGSLEKLTLPYCRELLNLPQNFGNLVGLVKLNLFGCSNLTSLPDSFGNLSSLTELDLTYCTQLSVLPESLGNLGSLEKLTLHDCEELLNLPQNFGNLVGLVELDLSHCSNLISLPDSFGNLSSLTKLDLSDCTQLSVLAESFGNLGSPLVLSRS